MRPPLVVVYPPLFENDPSLQQAQEQFTVHLSKVNVSLPQQTHDLLCTASFLSERQTASNSRCFM